MVSRPDRVELTVDLHWSEEEQMYCDVSVNEEGKFVVIYTSIISDPP